jgi:hypothetical protein
MSQGHPSTLSGWFQESVGFRGIEAKEWDSEGAPRIARV